MSMDLTKDQTVNAVEIMRLYDYYYHLLTQNLARPDIETERIAMQMVQAHLQLQQNVTLEAMRLTIRRLNDSVERYGKLS